MWSRGIDSATSDSIPMFGVLKHCFGKNTLEANVENLQLLLIC